MALVQFNFHPTKKQVREFGLISFAALPLVGWLWGASASTIGWLALAGLIVALVGLVTPRALMPLYVTLMAITMPLGIVIGELTLVFVYFGVFLPIGLVLRLGGRDALQRSVNRAAATYWQRKAQPSSAVRYYRQS